MEDSTNDLYVHYFYHFSNRRNAILLHIPQTHPLVRTAYNQYGVLLAGRI